MVLNGHFGPLRTVWVELKRSGPMMYEEKCIKQLSAWLPYFLAYEKHSLKETNCYEYSYTKFQSNQYHTLWVSQSSNRLLLYSKVLHTNPSKAQENGNGCEIRQTINNCPSNDWAHPMLIRGPRCVLQIVLLRGCVACLLSRWQSALGFLPLPLPLVLFQLQFYLCSQQRSWQAHAFGRSLWAVPQITLRNSSFRKYWKLHVE